MVLSIIPFIREQVLVIKRKPKQISATSKKASYKRDGTCNATFVILSLP